MNHNKWKNAPFQSSTGSLVSEKINTNLPFGLGSITRQGKSHIQAGINNQDAIHLIIERQYMVGILCDGMTNNHQNIVTPYSKNEFGAIFLTHLIGNLCSENMAPRKNKVNWEKFLFWLSLRTISSMKKIESVLRTPTHEATELRYNLFTSSIVGFIIREKEYFVFSCGDGSVAINGSIIELQSDYVSRYLNKPSSQVYREVTSGDTRDLQSLGIFSDGFTREVLLSEGMQTFLSLPFPYSGLQDIIPLFHSQVIESIEDNILQSWPYDDASAIIIKSLL